MQHLSNCLRCNKFFIYSGAIGNGGGLELKFYRVKVFKMGKISFFVLVGPW